METTASALPDDPSPKPSTVHSRLVLRAEKVAMERGPVLIKGESGTGKSMIAEYIHQYSPRGKQELVKLGCGEMDPQMIASTLFGHARGAFTGARYPRKGLLEEANGTSLLLDDIDQMPLPAQAGLLRFIDDGEYSRLGIDKPCKADVRVITTTNKDLEKLAYEGKFLRDLYFRLKCWRLTTTPLRERPGDIPYLASLFLAEYCAERFPADEPFTFDQETLSLLACQPWPGNVRELKQAVMNIALFARGEDGTIQARNAAEILYDEYNGFGIPQDSNHHLKRMLEITGGNISLTARLTGISRSTIYRRIEKNGWPFKTKS